ncbi:MAG TPA: response regulator [Candidatus Acidoferrales bacterium]|nr:response regulator [Candidatus Acidoferrales bacterium]
MKAVRVLVVDDNPLVRELLVKGFEPHAEVLTAADGVDALLKVVEESPDLIVCDYKLPGVDGRQFYEKIRIRDASKNTPFIFLAGRADLEEKLRPLVEGVEDFVQKPFYVRELVRRAKKVIDRLQLEKLQQKAKRPGVLEGRLEEMSIIDLFQSLEMGQKSCKLVVSRGGERCEMWFTAGACKHAVFGPIAGEQAVYAIMSWADGTFEIDFNASSEQETIQRSTQGLLMEGLRLQDEASRDAEPAP